MTAALEIRKRARQGSLATVTTGLAPGHIQANLLVVPASVATDFELLCLRNPVPCPLLGRSVTPGDPHTFTPSGLFHGHSADVIDIRTDHPGYNVYENGKLMATKSDIEEEWNESSVAFLIGCSFSFETSLTQAGLCPRQIELAQNCPMYITDVRLNPAGVFTDANMVVSMRPYRPEDIERVRSITRPFVKTHGEPVAWGWEGAAGLGIRDVNAPDFGLPTVFKDGEVPVFWVSVALTSTQVYADRLRDVV